MRVLNHISDLNDLKYVDGSPLYVVICGGIAVGKTHVVNKYLQGFTTVDFDHFMDRLGYLDYRKNGHQWKYAMDETDRYMTQVKEARLPIISQGTGGSYKWLKFRLESSRIYRYKTAMLHIHAPLDQALKQNERRALSGKRHVVKRDIHLIETSAMRAKCNFNVLYREEPHLVDYICEYDNTI